MRFGQAFSNVLQIAQQLRKLRLPFMNQLAESQAVNKFHCDEMHVLVVANLVDMRDVRMIQ